MNWMGVSYGIYTLTRLLEQATTEEHSSHVWFRKKREEAHVTNFLLFLLAYSE